MNNSTTTPEVHPAPPPSTPPYEILQNLGWFIGLTYGSYCIAWKDKDEVVFEWRDNQWHRLTGRGGANP